MEQILGKYNTQFTEDVRARFEGTMLRHNEKHSKYDEISLNQRRIMIQKPPLSKFIQEFISTEI